MYKSYPVWHHQELISLLGSSTLDLSYHYGAHVIVSRELFCQIRYIDNDNCE